MAYQASLSTTNAVGGDVTVAFAGVDINATSSYVYVPLQVSGVYSIARTGATGYYWYGTVEIQASCNGQSASTTAVWYGDTDGYLRYCPQGTWQETNYTATFSFSTANLFNVNNPETKALAVYYTATNTGNYYFRLADYTRSTLVGGITPTGNLGFLSTITLDAPPTFTTPSRVTLNHTYAYGGYTTASIKLSGLSSAAKYGGYIKKIKFQIGTDFVEQEFTSSNQPGSSYTMTLPLSENNIGQHIPTITLTDSRDQTTTKMLDTIVVRKYTLPTASIINIERINSDGTPMDEGTEALITTQVTCTKNGISNLIAPIVTLKNNDETSISTFTPVFTWYKTRDNNYELTEPLSTDSDWATINSGDTIYLKISAISIDNLEPINDGLNPNLIYLVEITPQDIDIRNETRSGILQKGTISTAFFTVDFLAGGHGIAFGQLASEEGFHSAMRGYFSDDIILVLDDNASNNSINEQERLVYRLIQGINKHEWGGNL